MPRGMRSCERSGLKAFWLLWVASEGTQGAWVQVGGELGSIFITSCKGREACPPGGSDAKRCHLPSARSIRKMK